MNVLKRYSRPRATYAKAIGDSCLFFGMSLMTYANISHNIKEDWVYFLGLGIAAIGHFCSSLLPNQEVDQRENLQD